ncbi:MAG: lipoyl protein ligase domain-containing protein [Terrimicrobiaceae bacterium]
MISELQMWEDSEPRTPSGQMAVDEAVLLSAGFPVLRLYHWASPAVTFGYAQRYADVRGVSGLRPAIRRWTGGGTVFHGEDLTLALSVPSPHPLCDMRPAAIYQQIHEALLRVVRETHPGARLAAEEDCRPGLACFQSPALNDLLCDGKKIGGGALRRGRNGFLYQGSLHGIFPAQALAEALSPTVNIFHPTDAVLLHATNLESGKYGTAAWNKMR